MPGAKFDLKNENLENLYNQPICMHMSSKEAAIFAKYLIGLHYSAGDMLFTQGNHLDDHLFIILHGEVEVEAELERGVGKASHLVLQKRGGLVGILAFIDGRKHVASAQAKSDVRVALITRQDYAHFKVHHPEIATVILEYLIVASDNIACQFLNKYTESIGYIQSAVRPRSMA